MSTLREAELAWRQEKADLAAEVNERDAALRERSEEIKKLQAELEEAQANLARSEEERSLLRAQGTQSELAAWSASTAADRTNNLLEKERETSQALREEVSALSAALKLEAERLEAEIARLEAELEKTSQGLKDARAQVATMELMLFEAQTNFRNAQDNQRRVEANFADFRRSIAAQLGIESDDPELILAKLSDLSAEHAEGLGSTEDMARALAATKSELDFLKSRTASQTATISLLISDCAQIVEGIRKN